MTRRSAKHEARKRWANERHAVGCCKELCRLLSPRTIAARGTIEARRSCAREKVQRPARTRRARTALHFAAQRSAAPCAQSVNLGCPNPGGRFSEARPSCPAELRSSRPGDEGVPTHDQLEQENFSLPLISRCPILSAQHLWFEPRGAHARQQRHATRRAARAGSAGGPSERHRVGS